MKLERLIPLIAVFAAGCTDQVEIRGAQSAITYDCADPRPAIENDADRALVLDVARKVVRYEAEDGRRDRVVDLERAFMFADEPGLEVALARYGCSYGFDIASNVRFPDPGSDAPVFSLPVLEGGSAGQALSLADLRGKIVVVNFWATWCKPCIAEFPELQEVSEEFASVGVEVVAILHRDSPGAAQAWVTERGTGFPVLLDERAEVARAYRVNGIPHTYIIGRDGTVQRVLPGYRPGLLREAVQEALARGAVAWLSGQWSVVSGQCGAVAGSACRSPVDLSGWG